MTVAGTVLVPVPALAETTVLHAGHVTAPPLAVRLAVAMVAGFAASVVMDLPMWYLDQGTEPPRTAASVLYGKPPAAVSGVEARSAHYAAGILAGVLFALLAVGIELVGVVPIVAVLAGGLPLTSHLLAGVGVFAFLYVFFGYVVLPRFRPEKRDVAGAIRGQWALSAAVYVLALWVLVVVVTVLTY